MEASRIIPDDYNSGVFVVLAIAPVGFDDIEWTKVIAEIRDNSDVSSITYKFCIRKPTCGKT